MGLARRKDPRTIELLLKELAETDVESTAIDAAEELGHPELLPALEQLKKRWPNNRREEEEWLDKAIASCKGFPEERRG
jgi:hypothetical protein